MGHPQDIGQNIVKRSEPGNSKKPAPMNVWLAGLSGIPEIPPPPFHSGRLYLSGMTEFSAAYAPTRPCQISGTIGTLWALRRVTGDCQRPFVPLFQAGKGHGREMRRCVHGGASSRSRGVHCCHGGAGSRQHLPSQQRCLAGLALNLGNVTHQAYAEMADALRATHRTLFDVHSGKPFGHRPLVSEAGTRAIASTFL